jgi:hypothetical protein
VGTFIWAWGIAGIVPIRLPFDLPALPTLTLPALGWTFSVPASSSMSSMAAVPEPASWALMIAGLLLIGASLRSYPRRRIQSAW